MAKSEVMVSTTFADRMKSMLRLDFYRLFHTPLFYIMISIAAIIPAMMVSMVGDAYGDNVWNVVAADHPIYILKDMGQLGNINMIYIFGGIMLAIFIGHDYTSGFIKSVFTNHSLKHDYILSKSAIGLFSMLCMLCTYLVGTVFAGIMVGKSFEVNIGNLLCCLLSKYVMAIGFTLLYTALSVSFRRKFGLAITGAFFFGTGILIMGAAMILGEDSPILDMFLYGRACSACMTATPTTVVSCLAVSAIWAAVYTVVTTFILNRRDLA